MSWQEITSGLWQRPIGENEAMIKTIGDGGRRFGKDVWSISVTASISMHVDKCPVEMLRDGWKGLRFQHPSIAAVAGAGNNVLEYRVPSLETLEHWASETFVVVDGDVDVDDVIAGLGRRRFATLYYIPKKASLVLHLSHWRTDGIGAFYLLDAYFRTVTGLGSQHQPDSLAWGEEPTRLVPSVEQALQLPSQPTLDIEAAANRYLGTVTHAVGALPTWRGPSDQPSLLPRDTRNAHLQFGEDETQQLQTQCRRLEISLEAAIHASVTAAAYSIADPAVRHTHHTTTMRQSLRPHLPPPYHEAAGAAGLYTAGYMVKVPCTQSWWENARQYDAEYRKGATPDLLCSRRFYASVMTDRLKNAAPAPRAPPSGLDVSWVPNVAGLVQPEYGVETCSLQVNRISIGVDVTSRQMYVFMWLFKGRLEWRLVYNDAFYDGALADRILSVVREHLLLNLTKLHP